MLVVYRFLWIASSLGTVAILIMLSNPQQTKPVIVGQWAKVQQGRFALQIPAEFRAYRDALTQMGMNKPNSPVQLQDAVRIERGARTGIKLALVTLRTDLQTEGDDANSVSRQEPDPMRLLNQIHQAQLQNLRETYADFKEVRRSRVQVQGVFGLRTDYEYTLTHWIPFFNMPVQGYLITLPVSQSEVLHGIAYSPPHRFREYDTVYAQVLKTVRLNTGTTNTAMGGW